jgi:hypothetical protein
MTPTFHFPVETTVFLPLVSISRCSMPLLVSYDGRPVKRRRRVQGALKLTFYAAVPGQPVEQVIVTEAQWQTHCRIEPFDSACRPDVRAMACRVANLNMPTGC